MEDRSPISFEEYLQFNENGRGNLGDMLPVTIYRMLEYSIKEELVNNFGKEKQIEIFRKAGRKSGEYFAKNMMNLDQPLDSFLSELQRKLEEFKIGVLRIESIEEKSGKIILTVSEDADCSGRRIQSRMRVEQFSVKTRRRHLFRLMRTPVVAVCCSQTALSKTT